MFLERGIFIGVYVFFHRPFNYSGGNDPAMVDFILPLVFLERGIFTCLCPLYLNIACERIDNVGPSGLLLLMRCDFPIDIHVSGRVHSTNRTNRSSRQYEMQLSDPATLLVGSLFRLTNRTNRSNRQHFVQLIANEMQFSDRQQIECCFFGWTLFDSIRHEWYLSALLYYCNVFTV